MNGRVRMLMIASLLGALPAGAVLAQPPDHAAYERLLKKHVRGGLVDYRSIKLSRSLLEDYLKTLEETDPDEFETWSREERMAFWINAYNAVTIHGIVEHYPIRYGGFLARIRFPRNSIRQIDDFWDTVFIRIMGREITLDEIEHEILRGGFGDWRVHFSLVCASIGCPLLSSEAYRGESLDEQLERDAARFINNEEKVRLDTGGNILYLSSIFKWYALDFSHGFEEIPDWLERYGRKKRGAVATVVRYMDETDKRHIILNRPKVRYLDYDWSLNELERE